MVLIVCVGNRFVERDSLGPRVHDRLSGAPLPDGVGLLDGGMRGLNLLGSVEGARRLIFVDALRGFAEDGEIFVLEGAEAIELADEGFGHSSGLGYLLKALEVGCEGPAPRWAVVGAQGVADEALVAAVARKAVELARGSEAEAR